MRGAISPVVLVVTGLKREAALLAGPKVLPVVGGGDRVALERKLERALSHGPIVGVISVGLAGALSPELEVGDWLVADRIACTGGGWSTDADWQVSLVTRLTDSAPGKVLLGPLAAGDAMIVDAVSKAQLHTGTGALAVDMESHIAAWFAASHGLPFAAVRVISDAADRALPKAAQAGMRKDGGMDLPAVLRSLAMDPRQLPALIRTGREAQVAFRRLALLGGQDGGLLGPGIGCPYLG